MQESHRRQVACDCPMFQPLLLKVCYEPAQHLFCGRHRQRTCICTELHKSALGTPICPVRRVSNAFSHEASSDLAQLCEVQSWGRNTRASSRSVGIGVGSFRAPVTCMKKDRWLFLERASAAPLSAPGMCCANSTRLCLATKKNRLRNNCIAFSDLHVPVFTIATTAICSE